MRELIGAEGKFAAMVREINFSFPYAVAHNELLFNFYPFYPLLNKLIYSLGLGIASSLRLTSILGLGLLGVTVFETSRRASGLQAAVVSAAFMFSNVYVFQKAIDGNPFTLGVLFLYLAWLSWYGLGALKSKWDKAWIVSLTICGLAFYTIGWMSILYFFVPLIFMRRPLSLRKKIKCKGFYIGIIILLLFIVSWLIPRIAIILETPFSSFNIFSGISKTYLQDFILFPLAIAGGLLPWTFIAWTSICVDYFRLDKTPIFSRFLRTIFISLFFLLLISPFSETRDVMLLIPAISIVSGLYYWLLVRRHGKLVKKIFSVIASLLLASNIIGLLLYLIPTNWWYNFFMFKWIHNEFLYRGISFFSTHFIEGVIQLIFGITIGVFLLIHRKNLFVWFHSLSLGLIFMMFFWSITIPYRAQENESKETATHLINKLGKNYSKSMTIYKGPKIADLYILGTYLDTNLKKIYSLEELPDNKKTIYMLSADTPIFPERDWGKITEISYKNKSLYLWKGTLDS